MTDQPISRRKFVKCISIAGGALYFGGVHFACGEKGTNSVKPDSRGRPLKLYWFIPDGLRADPITFQLFKWAKEGRLPNIKLLMEEGAYGYSIPVFPGHTPTNFATLLTGSTPKIHGVADGPMRIEGYPLKMVSKGGFSSIAKKVPPIWYTLEKQQMAVTLLSIPGSTPPELNRGRTIRGRWGGWGLDFPAVNFHCQNDTTVRKRQGFGNRVFYFGSELTRFIPSATPHGWRTDLPASAAPPREVILNNWGTAIYGYIYASRKSKEPYYDSVLFSKDKRRVYAHLKEGEWSSWLPITLFWQTQNDYNLFTPKRMAWERELSSIRVETDVRIKVIKLGKKNFFRIRLLYNNLNKYLMRPPDEAEEINVKVGPMVDFVDNYPPQLIYYPEDKVTFLEEARWSMQWHQKTAAYLMDRRDSDVIIHSTYSPNQMLTSRWWLGFVDPDSPRYHKVGAKERAQLWKEVIQMYQRIDAIIGEILKHADQDCCIVLSSDHGAVSLDKEVLLNNLFAKAGLLFYRIDSDTGEYRINWEKTRAVFLKMDNIYINPAGLGGNYRRASGKAYEVLRDKVTTLLMQLQDDQGICPVQCIVPWERAHELHLPKERVGDLIVANRPHYGWIEEISDDLTLFRTPLKSGYKQAILPDNEKAMWTPFIIKGPGIRKNFQMKNPIRHIDQYPTLMKLLKKRIPEFVEGSPLEKIFL
jgi:predicted AlkP superfamily phosphohydrolase/phosphomutase